MLESQTCTLPIFCVHLWLEQIFTAQPACPRSSRGLVPRHHWRERLRSSVAAVREAARNQGEKFRNASGSKYPHAIQEMLSLPALDSCEARDRLALRNPQWEATRPRY